MQNKTKRNTKTKHTYTHTQTHTQTWTHYVQIIILKLVKTEGKRHFEGSPGGSNMTRGEKTEIAA